MNELQGMVYIQHTQVGHSTGKWLVDKINIYKSLWMNLSEGHRVAVT